MASPDPAITELEAQILASPDDADAYLVLADLLTSQGDPRGELISLSHRLATGAADKMLRVRANKLLDRQQAAFARAVGIGAHWHLGYVRRAAFVLGIHEPAGLRAVFTHPSARLLTELEITCPVAEPAVRATLPATLAVLAEQARPTLRSLVIHMPPEERVDQSSGRRRPRQPRGARAMYDDGVLWLALPNLVRLQLAGDPMFPDIEHATLRTLVLDETPIAGEGDWRLPGLHSLDWGGFRDVRRHVGDVATRVARQHAALQLLWLQPLPALRDLTLRGYLPDLISRAEAVALVAQLERLCIPFDALLPWRRTHPATLDHLARVLLTGVRPFVIPRETRRDHANITWCVSPGDDRQLVHLDAKLPRTSLLRGDRY